MVRLVSYCCRARFSIAAAGLACACSASASAEVIDFAGYQIDIDATVTDASVTDGLGDFASVLVIDWDTFGGPYVSPSHAFLYRWDGQASVLDMLTAFQDGGIFTFTGTSFLGNINYTDSDGDNHANPVVGNWELASGTNPFGAWDGFDTENPDWDFSLLGINDEPLADGQFEGINAAFYDPENDWARVGSPLTVPVVPEPGAIAVLLGGVMVLAQRRRRKAVYRLA